MFAYSNDSLYVSGGSSTSNPASSYISGLLNVTSVSKYHGIPNVSPSNCFASHAPSKYLSLSSSSTNSSISVVASNSAKLAPNEVFKFTTSGALSALTSDSTFCSRSSAGTSNQSIVTLGFSSSYASIKSSKYSVNVGSSCIVQNSSSIFSPPSAFSEESPQADNSNIKIEKPIIKSMCLPFTLLPFLFYEYSFYFSYSMISMNIQVMEECANSITFILFIDNIIPFFLCLVEGFLWSSFS